MINFLKLLDKKNLDHNLYKNKEILDNIMEDLDQLILNKNSPEQVLKLQEIKDKFLTASYDYTQDFIQYKSLSKQMYDTLESIKKLKKNKSRIKITSFNKNKKNLKFFKIL